MPKLNLTICSVFHSEDRKQLLDLNYAHTQAINTRKDWVWLAAENTPHEPPPERHSDTYTIIPGKVLDEIASELPPPCLPAKLSYHPALALDLLIERADTRFILILDNDFYIVYPEWIETMLTYMQENDLAFLGVPWHPRWWKKVRYFPAQFSLFIDTEKIDKKTLDFRPGYDERHPSQDVSLTDAAYKHENIRVPIFRALAKEYQRRLRIGKSRDTSFRIYDKYYKSAVKYECITPVFKPYKNVHPLARNAKKYAKKIIPDRFLYIPKDESYYTETGFHELGYPNVSGETGWEEYIWHGRPFGFHIRGGSLWVNQDTDKKIRTASLMLEEFRKRIR